MRKIICDRCGNDIKDDTHIGIVYFTGNKIQAQIPEFNKADHDSDRRFELCSMCVKGTYRYITRFETAEAT